MSFFKKLNNLDIKRNSLLTKNLLQLGQDIDGEATGDQSGWSVSMNAAGDRVAIGAVYNDAGGSSIANYGHVRVYSWNGTTWTQLGQDINGKITFEESGTSVSMNAAGDRVAIGAPFENNGRARVYSWNGTAWTQLGLDIPGEWVNDEAGVSVSINAAGDRIAIGADENSDAGVAAGHVRIHTWNGTAWTQLGQDLNGIAGLDFFGRSVSMNAAGDRVAIGAIGNDVSGTKTNAGHVRVFSLNGTTWTQLGLDINGKTAEDQSGTSVSMNAAGDRVAIGAPLSDANGTKTDCGHVRVFSWNGSTWTQLGTDIDGESAGDQSGRSVSMNAAGDRVAIGARLNGTNFYNAGHVRVYSWNGTTWTQSGVDIDGEFSQDESGRSVSMNAAGDIVAIGASNNNIFNNKFGHVRIYKDYTYYTKIDIWTPKFELNFADIAISSNVGIIWGLSNSLGGQKDMWTSVDYGNNWSVNSFITTSPSYSIAMSSNGVARTYVTYGGKIYVSTNSGTTWTARENDRAWYRIAMSSTGAIQTAVEYTGQIYVSTNSGTNWTARDSARNWEAVAMSSNGAIQTAVVYNGQIYVSTNSGTTWTAKESTRNWKSVAMSSDGTKQTAVVQSGQIYVSIDSGNTWTAKESVRDWRKIAMSSDGIIQTAVANLEQVYVSTNSGITWTAKESVRGWNNIAMSSNGLIQVAMANSILYVSL